MRILLISNYKTGIGGISGQVELLYKYFSADCVNIKIFSTKASIFKRLLLFFNLLITGAKFDVFHVHGCSYWGFLPIVYGVIAGKILNKKIIVTYHGGSADEFFAIYPKLIRFFLKRTDTNIVLSGFLSKIFDEYKLPYVVIPNFIEFSNDIYRKRDYISPKFISVRTLAPNYNIKCIINAFDVVRKKIKDATLTILSDGECRSELEDLVNKNKIQGVQFLGQVSNSKIYDYLDKSDIMLSSPLADNQPVSILEAFNAGLLVISSNVGGVPYMVEDGRTGLLFESDNSKNLADKMEWAIMNQHEVSHIIDNANKDVQKHSWENIKQKLIQIYNESI